MISIAALASSSRRHRRNQAIQAPPGYASLTSTENGLVQGLNFDDDSIVDSATLRSAIFAYGGGAVPATGKWTYVSDDLTFLKVARLTPPVGDFAMYLDHPAHTRYSSVRIRMIVRYNNWLSSELATYRLWSLFDVGGTEQLLSQTGISGNRSLMAYDVTVDSLGEVLTPDTAIRDDLILGEWREVILEFKDNGDDTYTMNEYQTPLNEERVPFLTKTSDPEDYIGPDDPEWDGMWIGSVYGTSAAGTIDFALFETCTVYVDDGYEVPIENLGTDNPIPGQEVGPEGEGIMGADPELTPHWFFHAPFYEDDAALRADIRFRNLSITPTWIFENSAKNGTGGDEARFQDGQYFDLIDLDESVTILGQKTLRSTIRGANLGNGAPTCIARSGFEPIEKAWVARRDLYPADFTNTGDADSSIGIAYNAGTTPFSTPQVAALKDGPWLMPNTQDDRAGRFSVFDHELGVQALANHSGVPETIIAEVDTLRWNGIPGDMAYYIEMYEVTGTPTVAITTYYKDANAPNSEYEMIGTRQVHSFSRGSPAVTVWEVISALTENHNMSRATDIYWWAQSVVIFDATNGESPWGIPIPS